MEHLLPKHAWKLLLILFLVSFVSLEAAFNNSAKTCPGVAESAFIITTSVERTFELIDGQDLVAVLVVVQEHDRVSYEATRKYLCAC